MTTLRTSSKASRARAQLEIEKNKVALPSAFSLDEITAELERRNWQRYPDLWLEQNFREPEGEGLIVLFPFQRAVLRYATKRRADGSLHYRTVIWSQPKKSGKTTISGGVGRWAAETWGKYGLVLCVGNDAGQAQERAFAAIATSIEMQEGYERKRRELAADAEKRQHGWRIREDELTCTNGSTIKAIAADYSGEAGANPSLTIYTELWGFIHKGHTRFWAEMAPSPTRKNSMRWVETYAGYEGESELLWGLYETVVKNGRQLTVAELEAMARSPEELAEWTKDGPLFAESPEPDDLVPCYVNEQAGMFAFWDSGVQARRMPWQQGERGAQYYANEAGTQTEAQMTRLHLNEWVSGESPFVPIEWWDDCGSAPLPPLKQGDSTPVVIAMDAAVTGDCFGLVMLSRVPGEKDGKVAVRAVRKFTPKKGEPIDFAEVQAVLGEWCGKRLTTSPTGELKWVAIPGAGYNVKQIAYDPYQLHDFATRNMKAGLAWFRPFPQGIDRLKADKSLYDLIRDRRIVHDGNTDLREHIANCNAKSGKDEDSKLRIIKKSENRKIDLAVCVSMGASECLRLFL